jgi:hypothetical protein
MNAKFTLAIIALVGIGVFALPSTMSLFSGQHTFYNIDATGNQVPCQKCHGDVKAELSGSMATSGSMAPHARFQCEYCHRAETGFASGDDAYVNIRYQSTTDPNATGRLGLMTTISNFEAGNFPKVIEVLNSGITVANWNDTVNGNIYQIDGTTPFLDKPELRIDFDPANGYDGVLGINVPLGTYEYSRGSLTALRNNDGTLKTNMTDTYFELTNDITCSAANTCVVLDGSGSNVMTPGQTYHAASLVSCLECHGGEQLRGAPGYEVEQSPFGNHRVVIAGSCGNCHYGGGEWTGAMAAGGFADASGIGLTTGTSGAFGEGSVEAHNEFVVADPNGVLRSPETGYGANNIACVACHTHVAVDINFQKAYKVAFDAANTATGSWTVDNFAAEGQVNIAIYGNGSGMTYATGDKSYTWDGASMYVNGATVKTDIALTGESSDNETALTT